MVLRLTISISLFSNDTQYTFIRALTILFYFNYYYCTKHLATLTSVKKSTQQNLKKKKKTNN